MGLEGIASKLTELMESKGNPQDYIRTSSPEGQEIAEYINSKYEITNTKPKEIGRRVLTPCALEIAEDSTFLVKKYEVSSNTSEEYVKVSKPESVEQLLVYMETNAQLNAKLIKKIRGQQGE